MIILKSGLSASLPFKENGFCTWEGGRHSWQIEALSEVFNRGFVKILRRLQSIHQPIKALVHTLASVGTTSLHMPLPVFYKR